MVPERRPVSPQTGCQRWQLVPRKRSRTGPRVAVLGKRIGEASGRCLQTVTLQGHLCRWSGWCPWRSQRSDKLRVTGVGLSLIHI